MDKAEEKRQKKELETLQNKYSFSFTKAELIEIFHAIAVNDDETPRKYNIAVGAILFNVMRQIQPIVAVASNIPPKEEPKKESKLDLGDKLSN